MVIGGGKITHYLVELLNRHTTKANIKIIEKDRSKCESLYEALSSASLNGAVCSFMRRNEWRTSHWWGIDTMDACVCLTDRDEENVFISFTPCAGSKEVITKINYIHQNMAKSLGLWLGNIITPQYITAKTVIRYVTDWAGGWKKYYDHSPDLFRWWRNVDAIEFQWTKKQNALIHL